MHGPVASAISVILFVLSALAVAGAARQWAKLARNLERPDERPAIPVHAFRAAAGLTSIALTMVAASLAWSALVAFPLKAGSEPVASLQPRLENERN